LFQIVKYCSKIWVMERLCQCNWVKWAHYNKVISCTIYKSSIAMLKKTIKEAKDQLITAISNNYLRRVDHRKGKLHNQLDLILWWQLNLLMEIIIVLSSHWKKSFCKRIQWKVRMEEINMDELMLQVLIILWLQDL
jgi:hypothetical protein